MSKKKQLIESALVEASDIIEGGRHDLLKEYVKIKNDIEYLTAKASAIHDAALSEFDGNEIEIEGRTITQGEFGTKYDFSNCGHIFLPKFELEATKAKAKLDDLKKEIKALKEARTYVDEDTGEAFKVLPPTKTSTTKLKIS